MRRQWISSINAAVKVHGINYSKFLYGVTRSNIALDRKIMADLAVNEPLSFRAVMNEVTSQVKLNDLARIAPKY